MEYKVFRPDYLENISGGDPAIKQEIAGIFRDQMPEFVAEMKRLLAEKQYYDLGLLAHKAKGSVTVMGMDGMAAMLKIFELQAKAGENPADYPGYIARFEEDADTVLRELDDYLKRSH